MSDWSNTAPTAISVGVSFNNTAPSAVSVSVSFSNTAPTGVSNAVAWSNTAPSARAISGSESISVALMTSEGTTLSAPLAGNKIFYLDENLSLQLVDPLALRTDGDVDFGAVA